MIWYTVGIMQSTREEVGAAFKEAYASLNAAQKKAVDTIEGPVLVIAGPGTGKTQILTLRIAKILLETQMDPENILALTFTEAGVKAMRERLHHYVGPAAYRVSIHTFHGFADRLIREYPDAYPRIIGGRPASQLEKIEVVTTILDDPSLKVLRPTGNPLYHLGNILNAISGLKGEYITPDKFTELITKQEHALDEIEQYHTKGAHKGKVRGEYQTAEKELVKNRELLQVYRQYEALMTERRLYDFEDMIVETVQALTTDEDVLLNLQERYQYVLADEHQDVNGAQNAILEQIVSYHDAPNIFVVGDEKQAIYRFQGASLENFLYFEDRFTGTTTISLDENYRSGQTVLDTAQSLVATDDPELAALRIPLTAQVITKSSVEKRTFSHQDIEDTFVAEEVARQIAAGTSPEEIAIIVRTNREVEAFAALLRKAGIPVEASADADILEHPLTHTIEALLQVVAEPDNEAALFTILHGPYWGIEPDDMVRITSARTYKTSLISIMRDRERLAELGVRDVDAVINLVTVFQQARDMQVVEVPQRVIEYILTASGLLEHVLTYDPLEGGRVIRRLYDEIEQLVVRDGQVTLRAVSEVFAAYRTHRIPLSAPYIATRAAAVQVMTAHKSKGLEFDVVFIPHLADNVWGGRKKSTYFKIPFERFVIDHDAALDDERRLFYVAMTRARHTLFFSVSDENAEGREITESRLLADLAPEQVRVVDTAEIESAFTPTAQLATPLTPVAISAELLATQLTRRGLSPTALNNYLNSPWNYLYRNILRIPEVQAEPLLYGTAMHGVMEWVSATVASTGTVPSVSAVSDQLTTQLQSLPINHTQYASLHEKGLAALVVYLEHATKTLTPHGKVELNVTVTMPTGLIDFPEVTLTGKLDRLDCTAAGEVVRVVDYKTGKPKTRNDIEGKTKTSNGEYKRQLVFYALLLELYDDAKYACRTGVLSFIEPNKHGAVVEETFTITDEDITVLKEEIIDATKAITTGAFLDAPCDPAVCNYCDLAAHLRRAR